MEEKEYTLDDWNSNIDPEGIALPVGTTNVDVMAARIAGEDFPGQKASVMSLGQYDDIGLVFNKNTIKAYINSKPLDREVHMTVLHNSATPASSDKGLATVKSFNDYHINTNGWKCIGYHWVICTDGQIYAGRKMEYVGSHAGAVGNPGSMGVCLVGNFETTDKPTSAQKEAFAALHDALATKYYGSNKSIVRFHRDLMPGHTQCPGKITVSEVTEWVKAYQASTSVPPGVIGTPTKPRVVVDGIEVGTGVVIDNSTYVKMRDFEKAGYKVGWITSPDYVATINKPQ